LFFIYFYFYFHFYSMFLLYIFSLGEYLFHFQWIFPLSEYLFVSFPIFIFFSLFFLFHNLVGFIFSFVFFFSPFFTIFPFSCSHLFRHFSLYVSISILYSFIFNIFPPLIILLFEMRCKFVLTRIISCSGYKYLVRAIITTCSDPCSDLFWHYIYFFSRWQICCDYNMILS
jgi:hypothetical protein